MLTLMTAKDQFQLKMIKKPQNYQKAKNVIRIESKLTSTCMIQKRASIFHHGLVFTFVDVEKNYQNNYFQLRQIQQIITKMIRARGLITSIKSNLLTSRNAFPHKVEEWDHEFSQQNPKLNYLGKLLQTNEIRPYFIQKDIKELEKEDIYFYIFNKEIFHSLPRQNKEELIKNPNANCTMKFRLALQLDILRNQEVQKLLLQSFNASIQHLSVSDTLFCLQMICTFKNVKEDINFYQVEKKILVEENPNPFLKSIYLLSELKFKLEMISNDLIMEKISAVQNYELETIFWIKSLAKFYQLQLTSFCENRIRSSFMEKRKNFNQEEAEFIVELLQFYPESANFLKLECMNAESYISYLQFFTQQQDQAVNQNIPKPIEHIIPHCILTEAEIYALLRIVKLRVNLQLETVQTLINNIKTYYAPNLNYVCAVIRFLEKQEKMTPETQSVIQRSILSKIIKHGTKAFEEYNIVDVFKIMGYLSVHELGTINFWKRGLKFVTTAIQDPQNYKNLCSDQQKKFVVYLFQIFKNKPFPRELEDQIINLTLLSLTINKWSIKEILPLVVSLENNKIADNELWFGLQQRIKKIDLRNLESHEDRRLLKKIVCKFNSIGKGSYEFWSEINKMFNKKDKNEILQNFRVPSTPAHIYLKL